MNEPVSLELVKKYLRLPEDFHDEDDYISLCVESATHVCGTYNQTDYSDFENIDEKKKKAVSLAVLKLAGFYFDNRDASKDDIPDKMKAGISSLLNSVRENFNF